MNRANNIIETLNLLTHPEGGFYKEVYRSEGTIPNSHLDTHIHGERNYCTSIYFLLKSENFSAFHKINQDEIWHFYEGSSLTIHIISPQGEYTQRKLGTNFENNEAPQIIVPAHHWFGATVNNPDDFSFVGCTVSPGFDFKDFCLASRNELLELFPQHEDIINTLTHN